jgi:hypothetical protein
MLNSKKINFIPTFQSKKYWSILDTPSPMRKFLPVWYKEAKFFKNNNQFSEDIGNNLTFKSCVPFLDAMSAGYAFTLPTDVQVVQVEGSPRLSWGIDVPCVVPREIEPSLPTPIGCSQLHFAWMFEFGIDLPKGYSVLFTHPLNRHDLPFVTSSGLVSEGVPWGGKFSFWVKEGFEGIIPFGTPVVQLIPFKREDWVSERHEHLSEQVQENKLKFLRHGYGYYKKFVHKKQGFN